MMCRVGAMMKECNVCVLFVYVFVYVCVLYVHFVFFA